MRSTSPFPGLLSMAVVLSIALQGCGDSTDPELEAGPDYSNSALQLKTVFSQEDPQLFGEAFFVWDEVEGATHYRLYADADGDSDDDGEPEFVQAGDDIPAGTDPLEIGFAISAHLIAWDKAVFRLESCVDAVCELLGLQDIANRSINFIFPFVTAGITLAYAESGERIAVGAPNQSAFLCKELIPIEITDTEFVDEECEYDAALTQEEIDALILTETIPLAGAVSIYALTDGSWTQEAVLLAPNQSLGDGFGSVVSISDDGNTVAIGAVGEASTATGIDGDGENNDAILSGAVYVFQRDIQGEDVVWTPAVYIKASNSEGDPDTEDLISEGDLFGNGFAIDANGFLAAAGDGVALSGDGMTLAVSALGEDSNAMGIDGDQANNDAEDSGAVYVFRATAGVWAQEAYLKASNTDAADLFGASIELNEAGDRLAVGAFGEASTASGIDGDQFNNGAVSSGAVYLFARSGSSWSQQAYIKAANPGHPTDENGDEFGYSVSLNAAGDVLAVGAPQEDSGGSGVGSDQSDNSTTNTGAAYLFEFSGGDWQQTEFFKASNPDDVDEIGYTVVLNQTGDRLLVTSVREGSRSLGVNGSQKLDDFGASGAAYLFVRDEDGWYQQSYIKDSVNPFNVQFGWDADFAQDGDRLAISSFNSQTVFLY